MLGEGRDLSSEASGVGETVLANSLIVSSSLLITLFSIGKLLPFLFSSGILDFLT